ncbi:MAG TPA: STAS domain-containing protein [Thermoguttaceae bacterium]|nr:STAS domain-containing protein [Thermoguttaceae bacterium]
MPALAFDWDLDVDRGPDWLIVKICGAGADSTVEPSLSAAIWDLLQRHFTYRVVLELDQVTLLDSYLVGQLVQLYKLIRQRDGVMRVCGLSPYNRQVLHACRLDESLTPFRDREDAVLGPWRVGHPK